MTKVDEARRDVKDNMVVVVERRDRRVADIGERLALVAAWGVVIVIFGAVTPHLFLSALNFDTIFGSQAVLVVLTLALIIPLTAGDYDLSVAAVLTLSSMVVAVLNVEAHWPMVLCVLAALALGAITGLLNGAIMVLFGIDSIVVTLGSQTVLAGIVLWISGSSTISGITNGLVRIVIIDRLFGITLSFYYGLVLCIILWYTFEYTAAGRRLLFVGRSRSVSRLSGLNVPRLRVGALVASGTLSAAAGVLYAGTTGGADPTSGLTFLLPAFAAAFLGSTSIVPGRFNAWGTIIAVYFLVTGITGLQLLGLQGYVQDLFYGGALLCAVCLSQLARGRRVRVES